MGRAGRVRPGTCFGLYTRDRFENRLRKEQVAFPPPPIHARAPAERVPCLAPHSRSLGGGLKKGPVGARGSVRAVLHAE
jgi:hypothetical protein